MTLEQAIKTLHPDTRLAALVEVEYYAGFRADEKVMIACRDATLLACEVMQRGGEGKGCRNVSENHPVDEFICSECGFILQDYIRAVIDDHDNDMSWSEYEIEFCPHCGRKVDGDE